VERVGHSGGGDSPCSERAKSGGYRKNEVLEDKGIASVGEGGGGAEVGAR